MSDNDIYIKEGGDRSLKLVLLYRVDKKKNILFAADHLYSLYRPINTPSGGTKVTDNLLW